MFVLLFFWCVIYFTHCVTQHYDRHLQYPKLLLKYMKNRFVHFIYRVLYTHEYEYMWKKRTHQTSFQAGTVTRNENLFLWN